MTSSLTIEQAHQTAKDWTGTGDSVWMCGKPTTTGVDWAVGPEAAEEMLAALQAVIEVRADHRPTRDQGGILVIIEEASAVLNSDTAKEWERVILDGRKAGLVFLAPDGDEEEGGDEGIAALRRTLATSAAEVLDAEAPLPLPDVLTDYRTGRPTYVPGHGGQEQTPRYARASAGVRQGCCRHAASHTLAYGGRPATVEDVTFTARGLYQGFIPTPAEAEEALAWAVAHVYGTTAVADVVDGDLAVSDAETVTDAAM